MLTSDGNGGCSAPFTFGLNATSGGTSASTSTPSTTDKTVGASLAAATCSRSALGSRSVAAKLRSTEQLALDVRVLRGSRLIAQRSVSALGAGSRTVRVPIGRTVKQGRVTVQITARGTAGNRKLLSKIVTVPAKTAA